MPSTNKSQSTGKNIFLLGSAAGWLIVGASLIYLVPYAINALRPTPTTQTWMSTLSQGGYDPMLAIAGGGIAFITTVVANWVWYQKFE